MMTWSELIMGGVPAWRAVREDNSDADQSMPSEAELVSAGVDLIAASTPCFLPARLRALYLTVDPEMMG
jgi:hypothetical protein